MSRILTRDEIALLRERVNQDVNTAAIGVKLQERAPYEFSEELKRTAREGMNMVYDSHEGLRSVCDALMRTMIRIGKQVAPEEVQGISEESLKMLRARGLL